MGDTQEKDKGWKKFKNQMALLAGAYTTVGVHSDAGSYPDGTPVAKVAAWMEFGTSTIPARPWLRTTVEVNQKKIGTLVGRLTGEVMDGKGTVGQALGVLGFTIKTMAESRITKAKSWAAPLAPATVAAKKRNGSSKGSKTPLIDSTLLLRSVGFKTHLRGGDKS